MPVYYPKDHKPVYEPIHHYMEGYHHPVQSVPVYFDPKFYPKRKHPVRQSLLSSYEHLYYPVKQPHNHAYNNHQREEFRTKPHFKRPYSSEYSFQRGYKYKYVNYLQ